MLTNKVFLRKTKRGNVLKVRNHQKHQTFNFSCFFVYIHFRSSENIISAQTSGVAAQPASFVHTRNMTSTSPTRPSPPATSSTHHTISFSTRTSCSTKSTYSKRISSKTSSSCRRCSTRCVTRAHKSTSDCVKSSKIQHVVSTRSSMSIIGEFDTEN